MNGQTNESANDCAIDSDELQDFLAGDYLETKADNKFKEDLRKKLWSLVVERYGHDPQGSK